MSVSLLDVLENAGYDIRNNVNDANWLLSQKDEFDELCEEAEELNEQYGEYEDFIMEQEDLGNFDKHPTFEEWREEEK
jgi:hypothetical protein